MATEVINREELISQLWQKRGKVSLVAEHFSVTTQTIYNYAERYATVKNAMLDAQAHNEGLRVDTAETKLEKAIVNGERWAILHTLKESKEAKRRGWGAKTELEADGEIVIRVVNDR